MTGTGTADTAAALNDLGQAAFFAVLVDGRRVAVLASLAPDPLHGYACRMIAWTQAEVINATAAGKRFLDALESEPTTPANVEPEPAPRTFGEGILEPVDAEVPSTPSTPALRVVAPEPATVAEKAATALATRLAPSTPAVESRPILEPGWWCCRVRWS
jgi:hypothetical protein